MWQEKDRTLALAGVFQAAQMVKQLGMQGKTDGPAFQASLSSILKIDANDVLDVFGDVADLRLGLLSVRQFLDKRIHQHDALIVRYVLNILSLSKRVLKDPRIFQQLQRRLMPVISQATHLGTVTPIVITHLSTIYKQVFLERNLRIPIQGRSQFFKIIEITDSIRAILLAGIRAGVLWFQVGGNRWHLLFQRARLQTQVNALLHDQAA